MSYIKTYTEVANHTMIHLYLVVRTLSHPKKKTSKWRNTMEIMAPVEHKRKWT